MGNSLPKNPTYSDYTKYFSKLNYPQLKIEEYITTSKQEGKWCDTVFFLKELIKYCDRATKIKSFAEISRIALRLYREIHFLDTLIEANQLALKYGFFDVYADISHKIAYLYSESGDIGSAILYYEKSLDMYYDYACNPLIESEIRTKLVKLYIELPKFDKAYALLEKNADEYDGIFEHIRNEYLFIAGLCRIASGQDLVPINSYNMTDGIKHRFLLDIVNNLENKDEIINNFVKETNLTDIQIHILDYITKNNVNGLC